MLTFFRKEKPEHDCQLHPGCKRNAPNLFNIFRKGDTFLVFVSLNQNIRK